MSDRTTEIIVRTRFEGFHFWPDAPEEYEYLSSLHRHEFHVTMHKKVAHHNRDIEFISLKRKLDSFLDNFRGPGKSFPLSCEHLANKIMDQFGASSVEVSEDGENGAVVVDSRAVLAPDEVKLTPRDLRTQTDSSTTTKTATEEVKFEVSGPLPVVTEIVKLVEDYILLRITEKAGEEFWKGAFPCFEKKTECFVGYECEGPPEHRGKLTLFVPGSTSRRRYAQAWNVVKEHVSRIYFGAGNDRRFNTEGGMTGQAVFDEILRSTSSPEDITLEVDALTPATRPFCKTGITVVSLDPRDEGDADYIKFIQYVDGKPKMICWYSPNKETRFTDVNHPQYAKDMTIDQFVESIKHNPTTDPE